MVGHPPVDSSFNWRSNLPSGQRHPTNQKSPSDRRMGVILKLGSEEQLRKAAVHVRTSRDRFANPYAYANGIAK